MKQKYNIDDNPFLPEAFVTELKKEYAGTVYYDRYIRGNWTRAEGLLFPQFAAEPKRWDVSYEEAKHLLVSKIFIGLDIGGTKSHSMFVATGIIGNYQKQIRLAEKKVQHSKGTVDPDKIYEAYKANNEIVANAGNMAWINDLSVWKQAGKNLNKDSALHQLIDAAKVQTSTELKNLTQTTGFKLMSGYESIQNAYRRELDKAVIKICSGTFSQDKVLRDVVHNLAQSGLRSIDYASGYSMQLDTAARLAIRTGCHCK